MQKRWVSVIELPSVGGKKGNGMPTKLTQAPSLYGSLGHLKPPANVALYARVSSADQKEDLERQMQRLKDYAAAKGYQVT